MSRTKAARTAEEQPDREGAKRQRIGEPPRYTPGDDPDSDSGSSFSDSSDESDKKMKDAVNMAIAYVEKKCAESREKRS